MHASKCSLPSHRPTTLTVLRLRSLDAGDVVFGSDNCSNRGVHAVTQPCSGVRPVHLPWRRTGTGLPGGRRHPRKHGVLRLGAGARAGRYPADPRLRQRRAHRSRSDDRTGRRSRYVHAATRCPAGSRGDLPARGAGRAWKRLQCRHLYDPEASTRRRRLWERSVSRTTTRRLATAAPRSRRWSSSRGQHRRARLGDRSRRQPLRARADLSEVHAEGRPRLPERGVPRRGPGLIAGFRRRVADRTVHRMGGAETPTPPWRKRAIRENELVSRIELARREEQLIAQEGQNARRTRLSGEANAQSTREVEGRTRRPNGRAWTPMATCHRPCSGRSQRARSIAIPASAS